MCIYSNEHLVFVNDSDIRTMQPQGINDIHGVNRCEVNVIHEPTM